MEEAERQDRMNNVIREGTDFFLILVDLTGAAVRCFVNIAKILPGYVRNCLHALAHPENEHDWRFAWAYFVFPCMVIGFVLMVAMGLGLLLPLPWAVIAVGFWLWYMLGETFLFGTEGHTQDLEDWVERGGDE
jgi:hypothetical protein